jgi:hypothetical protein
MRPESIRAPFRISSLLFDAPSTLEDGIDTAFDSGTENVVPSPSNERRQLPGVLWFPQ